ESNWRQSPSRSPLAPRTPGDRRCSAVVRCAGVCLSRIDDECCLRQALNHAHGGFEHENRLSAIPHHSRVIESFLGADTIPLQRRRLCDPRTALISRHRPTRTVPRSEITGAWSRGCLKNSAARKSLIERPNKTRHCGL